uniref:Rx N-terminal domain-containing protein n=1 Tax=Aegilops tauschii subsp. strangulata TaxID=200361 RepID=A0A452XSP1_AEGTS
MEEIVLGLSKTVVEGTLVKVKAAIDEEAKLKLAVQSDLVFITGEFEMMQSFLNVADAERIKNNAVKTWVRQLRDLAYDTEDCIELVVHLDPKPRWWRRLLVLPCLPAVSLPMDDAAAEIKELKDRVEFVSQRNMRYKLITDFGGAKSVAQQQLDRAAGALDIAVEEAAKKGRSLVDLTELIPKMEDRPELGVISVWGTGGDLGVASIVRKAYDDPEICKNFHSRGWAKLTHPFDPRKILRSLFIQFCTNTAAPQKQGETLDVDSLLRMEKTVVEEGELVKQFVSHVSTHRFLVVLEGVSTMAEWDALRMYLPDMGNGSQIIVSTQHFDIASLCTGQLHKVSELRKFTPGHSVCVFFKEVCN